MMKLSGSVLENTGLHVTKIGFLIVAALFLSIDARLAFAASWSGTSVISPTLQPDPRGGSQINDVAVNTSGLTVAAWDQYNFYTPVSASVGIAIQSGGRWGAPCTFSGTAIPNPTADGNPGRADNLPCASTSSGTTSYSMTPKVAVGTDGTIAVSWAYQDAALPGQKVQVAVKPAGSTSWTGYTLATFTPGGVSITRSVPVAVDASGNVTAAWNMWDGTRNVVQAATLPSGGNTWSATSTLSGPGHDGLYFSLAVNARGDAGVTYSLSPYSTYSTGTAAYYVSRNPDGSWSTPVQISETLMSWVGYVVSPQVGLDANGLATVIYMGNSLEATRQLTDGSWTPPVTIVQSNVSGASYMSADLAVDKNGDALVALSIFDPTVNVDRASVWVTQGDPIGNWTPQQRITDPTIPVDAYATRVAVSPDGSLKLVGWIDHYHGTAQVAQWNGSVWNTISIGQGAAFSASQEVLSLDAVSGTVARAVWKSSTKKGPKIMATSFR
ncbi:MAG: hypothetical protein WBZ31_03475 [Thiobacillus sp.]